MADDGSGHEMSTRRKCMKYCGVVASGGFLAGCTGNSDSDSEPEESPTPTESGEGNTEPTPTGESTATSTETTEKAFSASMPPIGELTLEEPPASWVGGFGFTADLLTALGQGDGAVGMVDPRFWYQGFYDFLDGVSVPEAADLPQITTTDRDTDMEVVYDLEPDLMAIDPNILLAAYGLEKAEAKRIRESVAPWFGNGSRRKRFDGWTTWPGGESYSYVSLPEYIPKYAALFGEEERGEALLDLYEPFIEDIRSRVPQESERRSMALVNGRYNPENRDGWVVYNPKSAVEKTWGKKQYRDLNVVDAFEGAYGGQSSTKVGFEGLLEYDPDVIIFNFGITYRDFQGVNLIQKQRELLQNHPVGSEVTAIKNDDVYVGGTPYQGPIINMFQTEMAAKQLYPDEFGSYPGYGQLSESEQLFDRQRLADIVNGDI
ncbi:ABC-type Fe3+-hydroxamate transport system, substrate-binding protein [Halovenus aranensis]|uniref:ABC-type Fe3+-hydroxamate transport system, substrate-binding protein n=1 Tax=Halovenus aranensis TaxID=890420 RepID=A0A1G8YP59_9EURY|nr:ABC transporter substrate-binding protein [Halovenus aranensis]SDK04551.1 ABC-type Fe3+-hydroxamate transport system, substrate-binding protein [Halovenus aranensis]